MYMDLQKASMLKRLSAWLLDAILVLILVTGFAFVISKVLKYDNQLSGLQAKYEFYQNEYQIKLDISEADYEALNEEAKANYEQAYGAMNKDDELNKIYSMIINMTMIILTFSFLLAYIVTDVVVPMFFKNGQTIGKKIFEICLMQTDHTQVTTFAVVARAVLGKFTVETMIPVFLIIMIYFGSLGIFGTVTILLLLLLQIAVCIYTETNSFIHDLLAKTVVVDYKSQMIFENAQAMSEYAKN